MRVLIVEDDPAQRRLLTVLVRARGHEPVPCATLAEGRAAAPCEVALVDRRLPDGDGLTLARELPGRVYLLTGEEDAEGSGDLTILLKPVRPMDLERLLPT